jgi:cell division protein FtsI/penicillin-binding protein 2
MGAVTGSKYPWLALSLLVAVSAHPQQTPSPGAARHTLFSQSAARILQREYANGDTSYLLLDADSGALLASHWEEFERPIPLGSLVKPFTALAYADAHDFRYPTYECKGEASGCWRPQPHGKLDITSAVSVSCNTYFRRMAESVPLEQLIPVARTFGLEYPDPDAASSNLIGLGGKWRISPIHMAQSYVELFRRRDQPGVSPILEGMRRSALRGTGAAVDRQITHVAALVKTGTAPCTHSPRAPADGFVVALVPADQPEVLLLVRVHGVAGSKAAETAGRMLRWMED